MSWLKKVTAAAAASAIALSMASCGKDTTWGAEIDGTRLRAGILIYYQSSALSEAYGYMGEDDENVLDITIEDLPAREWINNKAVESMRKFAAVENKFDELGLAFENKEDELVKINAEQWWGYIGSYYEEAGVSQQSYFDIGINSEKQNAIFKYYYGEGGEKEIPEEEIKDYLRENYARIKYIEMPLKDGEGNILKSDGKADVLKMAEEYIERAKNGESFDVISKEWDEYYAALSVSEDPEEGEADDFADISEESSDSDDEPDYGTVITSAATFPSPLAAEKIFSGDMAENSYAIVEEFEVCYIIYKMDLFADPEYLENHIASARHSLRDEEFNQMIDGWMAAQNVVVNKDSLERYKLEKLTEY